MFSLISDCAEGNKSIWTKQIAEVVFSGPLFIHKCSTAWQAAPCMTVWPLHVTSCTRSYPDPCWAPDLKLWNSVCPIKNHCNTFHSYATGFVGNKNDHLTAAATSIKQPASSLKCSYLTYMPYCQVCVSLWFTREIENFLCKQGGAVQVSEFSSILNGLINDSQRAETARQ